MYFGSRCLFIFAAKRASVVGISDDLGGSKNKVLFLMNFEKI